MTLAANNYGTTSAQLRMRRGPLPGQTFPLAGEKTYIGRDQGNDIAIDDPEVSRRHAGITRGPSGYSIEDLGSTNGTFVNGIRITSPQALRDGDIIGLGQVVLAFEEAAEVSGDTVTNMAVPPPSIARGAPPPPAYAPPPQTAPATPAGAGGGIQWFLIGCGCVIIAVLLVAIVVAALLATGTISLPVSL
jgi:hypothetical protein